MAVAGAILPRQEIRHKRLLPTGPGRSHFPDNQT